MLTWDMGLDNDDNWFLLLSPNGDEELLKITQQVMTNAPEHMDWLFYSSRPAKTWNRQILIYDELHDELIIDASNWHYLVFDDEDEKLAIVLEATNLTSIDSNLTETAAAEFLIKELGELNWILQIGSVEVVSSVENEHEEIKNHISELKEHLAELQSN